MGVTGIGGLFFRSRDPVARAAWYKTHLGIEAGGESIWQQDAGMTVFAPFKADTDYFPADQPWMLNLRVEGLVAMAEALEAAGIAVERRDEWDMPGFGLFMRIHDPEGLPIELWEAAE
jgi:predicted enzyme related to lactoylglutathione lyase